MRLRSITLAILVTLGTAVSCVTQQNIPKPYFDQILALRNENVQLVKQCEDLQRQEAELQARKTFNVERMQTLAAESVLSLSLSSNEYGVNFDTLKIEHRK